MDESHGGGSRGTLPWCYCCAHPLLGQGTLVRHLVSGKKGHPKSQQVAPPNRTEVPPSVALQRPASPLRDSRVPQHPKHPGIVSQRKDCKLPFPATPAALPPKLPSPKSNRQARQLPGALRVPCALRAPSRPPSRDSPPRAATQRRHMHTATRNAFLHISPAAVEVSSRKEK